jgi:site-specific DNA-methyltransferase (adenine-specific)
MSPGYIARFKREHRLRKYPIDAFDALKRRLLHLHRKAPPTHQGFAAQLDARAVARWLPPESVSLVVTSPPYLKVVRYGKFNWIRLWLLQQSVQHVDRLMVEATDNRLGLSDCLRLPGYSDFIATTLRECSRVMKPGALVVSVIGDVESRDGTSVNLASHVWKSIRRECPLRFEEVIEDNLDVTGKVTRIWGSTKGVATKTDRILILRKPGRRRCRPRAPRALLSDLLRDSESSLVASSLDHA